MENGVHVPKIVVEELKLESGPATTQLHLTVVKIVREMQLKHKRVTENPVQVLHWILYTLGGCEM